MLNEAKRPVILLQSQVSNSHRQKFVVEVEKILKWITIVESETIMAATSKIMYRDCLKLSNFNRFCYKKPRSGATVTSNVAKPTTVIPLTPSLLQKTL